MQSKKWRCGLRAAESESEKVLRSRRHPASCVTATGQRQWLASQEIDTWQQDENSITAAGITFKA